MKHGFSPASAYSSSNSFTDKVTGSAAVGLGTLLSEMGF